MADSEEAGLQALLRRTEASARNAKAEHDAAVAAHKLREAELLDAKAKLGTVKRWKPTTSKDDIDIIESEFSVRMSETRLKIAADLVATIRDKLTALERARDHARIGLQAYRQNPLAARSAKEQIERRLKAEEDRRAAAEKRRQQLNEVTAEKARKLGGGTRMQPQTPSKKENEAPKTTFPDPLDRLKTEAAKDRIRREAASREAQRKREVLQQQQREREDKAKRDNEQPTASPRYNRITTNPPNNVYKDWHERTIKAFANYATIEFFPAPPYNTISCTKPACIAGRTSRALIMCSCDVEKAFRSLDLPSLKEERLRWHPDRFSRCTGLRRDLFQAKANEIFVVLDRMYAAEKDGKK